MRGVDAAARIAVTPEPSPEELVVIVASVSAALRAGTPAPDCDFTADHAEEPSRWARQGRREAIRGLDQAAASDGLRR